MKPRRATLIPALVNAVTSRPGRPPLGGPLVQGQVLAGELQRIYDTLLKPHFGNAKISFTGERFSRLRYSEGAEAGPPLGLAFLVWLSDKLEAGAYEPAAQVMGLLAIFNPIAAAEARAARNEKLPTFRPVRPATPLIPFGVSDDIDEAERKVSEGLKTLFGVEQLNTREIASDFYQESAAKACFLLYQRTVEANRVSRGFLVLQAPRLGSDLHSFNLWRRSAGWRGSRGFVLTLRSHHIFLGATGKQRAAKRPELSDALKCVVLDRNLGRQGNGIWPGLVLTHGPDYRPILGRCVLVRSRWTHSKDADLEKPSALRA